MDKIFSSMKRRPGVTFAIIFFIYSFFKIFFVRPDWYLIQSIQWKKEHLMQLAEMITQDSQLYPKNKCCWIRLDSYGNLEDGLRTSQVIPKERLARYQEIMRKAVVTTVYIWDIDDHLVTFMADNDLASSTWYAYTDVSMREDCRYDLYMLTYREENAYRCHKIDENWYLYHCCGRAMEPPPQPKNP